MVRSRNGAGGSRRAFLRGAAGASVLLALRGPRALDKLLPRTVEEARVTPDLMRAEAELAPLIERLIDTPRDRAIETVAEELRGGTPYRSCLAALFAAAARTSEFHHALFVVHAAHDAGLQAEPSDRLVPLFWAVDYFKWWQGRMGAGVLRPRPPLEQPLPVEGDPRRAFREAMDRMALDESERALLALAHRRGDREAMAEFWRYGARDWTFVGHRAIAAANAWRALGTIGWDHACAALRFLNGFMGYWHANGGRDQSWEENRPRAAELIGHLPDGWERPGAERGATLDLLAAIRTGEVAAACSLAAKQLVFGGAAGSAWDAVRLAGAELMLRHPGGRRLGAFPLHAVTSGNALGFAYRTAEEAQTRLLILLQAVGWMTEFTRVETGGGELRALRIDELAPAPIPVRAAAAAERVFLALDPGGARHREQPPATPESRDEAAALGFAYGRRFEDAAPFVRVAWRHTLRTAGENPHDLKFPVAVLEELGRASPWWRPHLLAAATQWLHSAREKDSRTWERARAALS